MHRALSQLEPKLKRREREKKLGGERKGKKKDSNLKWDEIEQNLSEF